VRSISRNDVMLFSRELLVSGGIQGKGLAPKTVNSTLSVMKNVFDYIRKEKGLQVPEISDICVKQPQKPMRILSRQEQQRLSRFLCDEPTPCHLGILLCLYTGLRIGEICALTWGDICIAEKYLYVHQTMQRIQIPGMTERKTKVVIQPPKSDCSIRKIPIPCEMMQILLPEQKGSNAFLLTGLERIFVEPRSMENQFKAAAKSCEITDVNFHALRHTFATRCVELGFDIKSLSEILGHASVNITLNRYVHPSMELKQKNMDMLSNLLTAK
jgi:integrase